MLLPQPGSAEGTALAGTAHTHMGMSYQGLVAGGNLRAERRSEVRPRSAGPLGHHHPIEVW